MKKFYFFTRIKFFVFDLICTFLFFIAWLLFLLFAIFVQNKLYIKHRYLSIFINVVSLLIILSVAIFLIVKLIQMIIDYKDTFEISKGILSFKNRRVKQNNSEKKLFIDISQIPFMFITRDQLTKIGGIASVNKENVEGKKCTMGKCYLLNKFVYDKERCYERGYFEYLNKRNDYKSQNYDIICSMDYQQDVFDTLLENGFCGDIYLSQAICEPRKRSFDEMFKKYNLSAEQIHYIE